MDLFVDPAQCAACGRPCAPGQVCDRGTCAMLPLDCVVAGGCAPGYTCEPTSHLCAPGCRLSSECPTGTTCSAQRTCECAPGQHLCGQSCVSSSSVESCGASCQACPTSPHGTAGCDAGTCVLSCADGYQAEGSGCVWQGAWTRRHPPSSPSPRSSHSMVYDEARGQVLLFGGGTWSKLSAELWAWDGTTWALLDDGGGPSARYSAAMAYDAKRQVTVLFGGSGITSDTWEWNGTSWAQRTLPSPPPARQSASAAYDAKRQRVVLAGGWDGQRFLRDTWEYDGQAWSGGAETASFTPSALTYEAQTQRVVAFGVEPDQRLVAAWSWGGTEWSGGNVYGGPGLLTGEVAVNHLGIGRSLFFGGQNDVGELSSSSWVWDWSSKWSRRYTSGEPPLGRVGHAMAFDARRGVVVLFGGRVKGSGQSPEWVADDTWEAD